MPTRYVKSGGVMVPLSTAAGGSLQDQFQTGPTVEGADTATSTRPKVTVTASATPHTLGSWVELEPSASAATELFLSTDTSTSVNNADSSTLLQIGLGASGSEVVWASLLVGFRFGPSYYRIPGTIPSGSRIAARIQSAVISKTINIGPTLCPVKSPQFASPVSLGANTATSSGLVITDPGASNTKGAWTDFTTSLTSRLNAVLFTLQGDAGMSAQTFLIDVGFDPTGGTTYQTALSNLCYESTTSELIIPRGPQVLSCDIPAGSRVAARYQRSGSTETLSAMLTGAGP